MTAASRVGCIRSNNEDMVLAYDKLVRSDAYSTEFNSENTDRFVIAVADGMGGHQAGEVASERALSHLKYFISDLPRGLSSGQFHETMLEWLSAINKAINSHGHADPSKLEMGTTLVGVLYYNGQYYWMNCGDSRIYRYRDGQLKQLSTDHSLNMVNGTKKHSNVITNCIGAGCTNSYMDMFDMTADVLPGDIYLLCSDGLNDMVDDQDIARLLGSHCTANALCEAAIELGGYDNVSACVFEVMD